MPIPKRFSRAFFAAFILCFLLTSVGLPQVKPYKVTRLLPSKVAPGDRFGYSVALSAGGNTAIVGANHDDNSGGVDAGSAYVFKRNAIGNWTQQARLQATDAAAYDNFGYSVAISSDGNTALVGSNYDDNSGGAAAGSAYVFTRNTAGAWSQQSRLQALDAAGSDFFGDSVMLSADGNTALVGAGCDDNNGGTDAGSAYVFTRNANDNWSQQTQLKASDAAADDYFGASAALSSDGNTALVGASGDDNSGGGSAGSAYVFTRSDATWSEQTRLQASDAAVLDQFGGSVALSADGNTALIGAHYDDNNGGTDAGSVYFFDRNNGSWSQPRRLQASDATAYDEFGYSVAISADGNTALVGATHHDHSGIANAGSAYVFARDGIDWTQQTKLQTVATASDSFGRSVALNSNGIAALVGARCGGTSGCSDAGSVHAYRLNAASWADILE